MARPRIPVVSYEEFTDHMHGDLADMHIPLDCSFELTYRCNLKCRHCYCVSDGSREELDLGRIRGILDELAESGCLWVLFTGGEPLLRPDFLDIYTYAKHKGLLVMLFTNGTLLTPGIADHLAEYRPFVIEISLYGATEDTYEKVTGVKGSYARCMRGIELARERELPLKLKTMITRDNYKEVPAIRDFANRIGVEYRFDAMLNPRFDGSKDHLSLRIPPRAFVDMEIRHKEFAEDWERFCRDFWNMPANDDIFICPAGRNSCHIDPYGKLQICLMTKKWSYDLKAGTFREGWLEFIPKVRAIKSRQKTKCFTCEVFPVCDRCPGWSLLETGEPESPVDYLCEIARLRAAAFRGERTQREREGERYGKEEVLSEAAG